MHFIREFIQVPGNQMVLAFGHGLVFFVMGFAILLVTRQRRNISNVKLAQSLPWLGLFGIVQAFANWGATFVPIQETYLSDSATRALHILENLLIAAASAFLLHFGARLWAATLRLRGFGHSALTRAAWAAFALWLAAFIAGRWLGAWDDAAGWINWGQRLARLGVAVPGAALTAWALVLQIRELRQFRLEPLLGHLRWLIVSVLLFGLVTILSAPGADPVFPPLTELQQIGLHADVLGSASGLLMAFFAVRILELFEIELGRRLESVRRMKLLLGERDRIARELHDGTMQSLYGIGLSLESASLALDSDPQEARKTLRSVVQRLDQAIQDMRAYVMDLRSREEPTDLRELLTALASELSQEYGVHIGYEDRIEEPPSLDGEANGHIVQIVREAVSNAVRHGRARNIQLRVERRGGLRIRIADDGVGFDVEEAARERRGRGEAEGHHGLRNMESRVRSMQGIFEIQSAFGQGTEVAMTLPERVNRNG